MSLASVLSTLLNLGSWEVCVELFLNLDFFEKETKYKILESCSISYSSYVNHQRPVYC